jgi:hypothetical protein
VAEYYPTGNVVWATGIGGSDYDYGMGICSSGNDVYVTGYFGSYTLNLGSNTIMNNGSYDTFLGKLNLITGIAENNSANFILYPNPVTETLTVTVSDNSLFQLTLSDLTGRKLLQKEFSNIATINTEQFTNGLYIYELRNKNGFIASGKVIKQ